MVKKIKKIKIILIFIADNEIGIKEILGLLEEDKAISNWSEYVENKDIYLLGACILLFLYIFIYRTIDAFQLRQFLKVRTKLHELERYEKGKEKKDENLTRIMQRKEESKGVDTNQILKKSNEVTLYLKECNNNDNNVKTSNNLVIGRKKPEESKYKDYDFFKIDKNECSRLHAFISKNNFGYFLSDNNTQNGTYLKVRFKHLA